MEEKRSKYSEPTPAGIRRVARGQLAAVLRAARGTITPREAAETLGLPRLQTARLLARWAEQGWLERVRRGIYLPVAIESARTDGSFKDPWIVAATAFAPCFIGGWSAAEHWGMTEQLFRVVQIATTRRPRKRLVRMGGIEFLVRTAPRREFFGLKTVWRDRTRVSVADPSRTIIDLLADPARGGGLRSTIDVFEHYLGDPDQRDVARLLDNAGQLGVGAVFKRLGYLLTNYAAEETAAIAKCAEALTTGNAKLDPSLPVDRLSTIWRLWLPQGWQP